MGSRRRSNRRTSARKSRWLEKGGKERKKGQTGQNLKFKTHTQANQLTKINLNNTKVNQRHVKVQRRPAHRKDHHHDDQHLHPLPLSPQNRLSPALTDHAHRIRPAPEKVADAGVEEGGGADGCQVLTDGRDHAEKGVKAGAGVLCLAAGHIVKDALVDDHLVHQTVRTGEEGADQPDDDNEDRRGQAEAASASGVDDAV